MRDFTLRYATLREDGSLPYYGYFGTPLMYVIDKHRPCCPCCANEILTEDVQESREFFADELADLIADDYGAEYIASEIATYSDPLRRLTDMGGLEEGRVYCDECGELIEGSCEDDCEYSCCEG